MIPIALFYTFVTIVNCYYVQSQNHSKSVNTNRLWFENILNLIIEAKSIYAANAYRTSISSNENNNNLAEKSQSYKVVAQAVNSNGAISNGNRTQSNNEVAKNQTNSNVASEKPKSSELKPIKYWEVPDRTYF
jgi:hypothetical protein